MDDLADIQIFNWLRRASIGIQEQYIKLCELETKGLEDSQDF